MERIANSDGDMSWVCIDADHIKCVGRFEHHESTYACECSCHGQASKSEFEKTPWLLRPVLWADIHIGAWLRKHKAFHALITLVLTFILGILSGLAFAGK
jgi:hypothetical protein